MAAGHAQERALSAALTPAQKAKLLAAAVQLPKTTGGRLLGAPALCTEAGLGSPDYITHYLLPAVEKLEDDDVPFERKEHSNKGVATKLTPTKDKAMMEQALEWGFDDARPEAL